MKDKNIWENFLLECAEKTFLSSWNWGEFNKMMGNKIWRLGVYNNGEPFSVALVVKTVAKRGTFLLVPHGPNIKSKTKNLPRTEPEVLVRGQKSPKQYLRDATGQAKILEVLLEELKKIAKDEGVDFIRISPIWERNEENAQMFKNLGFRLAPIHMHPEASWKLDITPSEEELIVQMRKTTRYLIRQAQKNNDIEIFQSQKVKDLELFDKLQKEVVKKQNFIPFSREYLKNEFLAFQPDNQPIRRTQGCPESIEGQISLFFGKYKGEITASAFVLFWSNIGFYHHAALLPQYNKIPIAYYLLWEAIKEAKKRGCNLFDFWGYVDPFKNSKHPWAGPTLFKMGFGGQVFEYVKTQDFVLSPKYWLTYMFEKLRKTKRSL